ncbi:MAG: hypothetical protein MK098_14020 [Marinovum sp.]|nr:hypothetical protein [Marinovum sp.]
MADIEELHKRLSQALQRIGDASSEIGAPGPDPALTDSLDAAQKALEEEKLVTSQLEERIRGLKEKHAEELEQAQLQSTGQSEAMAQVDVELQRLRKVAQQLRDNNAALREANAAGLANPELINQSMQSEIDALRAERAADAAEATAILTAMTPLVQSGGDQAEAL